MSDLRSLYQEIIVDHNKHPRNFHRLPDANRAAEGDNPLCGDRLTVYVKMADGVIREIGFVGTGCAISKASASLMTESMAGKTEQEADALFERFHAMVVGSDRQIRSGLGKLEALAGVREFPVRVKCATLAWHTLRTALKTPGGTVSTE
ncbi:MAG TPA: SUF system NifU family Fe-S cluster assembly protein [Deltaproteobacteria bacterium]|nr:MAG: SUF system NifU family Fe-S cluster assembly protein [Deltaproteobacteria bacterium GWA2_65_63]OGP29190.1 MAG: SUF system NifU family Fe-S cluster assembly protein [Deltaproteobacteria bacterium GWB2_65_81]OGP38801.1 MAG: SUF system NifU family Fe-S cluster assembly protein [Deltaproteobacteria bacterium GWC2_66_88]HAM33936.1 SUF system NifU family Fe-S cluster assembly protein [Deltaproteobacteria bacterium]HBG72724.1 SUF system NifU family Fe-S cluster assembly protein [Deltaproteobac